METITYDDKINFLDDILKRAKLLHETCEACMPQKNISIIEIVVAIFSIVDISYIPTNAKKIKK